MSELLTEDGNTIPPGKGGDCLKGGALPPLLEFRDIVGAEARNLRKLFLGQAEQVSSRLHSYSYTLLLLTVGTSRSYNADDRYNQALGD